DTTQQSVVCVGGNRRVVNSGQREILVTKIKRQVVLPAHPQFVVQDLRFEGTAKTHRCASNEKGRLGDQAKMHHAPLLFRQQRAPIHRIVGDRLEVAVDV